MVARVLLLLGTLCVYLTLTRVTDATATPAARRADSSTTPDVVPTVMTSRVSFSHSKSLSSPPIVTESDDSSSSSNGVLLKIIAISVPSLTGILILAVVILVLIRLRKGLARRIEEDALSARSSVPPQSFLPEPTHRAISNLRRNCYNRGSDLEGSDAFPDNYKNFYGGLEASSQLSSDSSEVNLQKVTLLEEIGSGCFSKVYLAILSKKTKEMDKALQVAVKLLKFHEVPVLAQEEMAAETEILRILGYCPYIVNMLGSGTKGENMYIITEYADLGNLQDFLRSERETTLSSHHLPQKHQEGNHGLTELDLIGYAEQIIFGMDHVSRNGVVHNDLALRNILVFSTGQVKVSDFGLAHYVSQNGPGERLKGATLPLRWMPPEGIFHREYSLKSDVWAFGILLWEIVTLGSTPYPDFTDARLMKKLRRGYRIPRPPYCSNQLYHVMRGCWHNYPDDRPTFQELRDLIAHILCECRINADPTHIDYSRITTLNYQGNKGIVSSDDERYSDVFTGTWASTDSDSSYKRSSSHRRSSMRLRAALDRASRLDAEGGIILSDEMSSSTQHLTDYDLRSDDTE